MAVKGKVFSPDERLNYIYAFIQTDMKDIRLDFYQEQLIKADYKFRVCNKSRQIGWSFIVALGGIVKANDPARIKYTKQFVSYTEDDAMEKIRYAKEFYESIPKAHKKPLVKANATSMEFLDIGGKTTSRLISVACRPPRGKNGDISFDEMAIYPPNRSRGIYTAGLYCVNRGGHLEVGSTPLGAKGIFYDIISDKRQYANFARYNIPWWYSAINCIDVETAVTEAPLLSTEDRVYTFGKPTLQSLFESNFLEDFQQETECMFIDSAGSYITLELIQENTPGMRASDRAFSLEDDDDDEKKLDIKAFKTLDSLLDGYDPDIHGALYLGYDVAKKRDAAVIYVIGVINEKKRCVAEIEMREKAFAEQKAYIGAILTKLPVIRACMDSTGQGLPIAEDLQREFGADRVEAVVFTVQSKESMCINVRGGLERREYLLQNSLAFHKQIHSIRRIETATKNFRYDAERDDKGHADSFWAWALASLAVTTIVVGKNRNNFYQQYAEKKTKGGIILLSDTAVDKKYIVPPNLRRLMKYGGH